MKNIYVKSDLEKIIKENDMVLLYFGSKSCGVCHAMKPKIDYILRNYPKIISLEVDTEKNLDIAAFFNVFSIPGILLFIDGKESIREARFMSINELNDKISRYYQLYFEK